MNGNDADPPVADDDFPEFSEPPRHKPVLPPSKPKPDAGRPADNAQDQVDDVIARLRRERAERKREN